MRLGEGVEWAIHCCTLLAVLPDGAALPAARLAEYHEVAPAYLAKHLQALRKAGLVAASP
ncbi:MAG: Rrf2 family transcriptional regulator, partial [Acidimicrobiales bacterium]|nr:Rrf2 family transcriptional regulator [Acidimicrobiales bacterium]